MLPVYIEAFTLTPPEILHRRLFPFSIGHAFLLEAAGSGYSLDGQGGDIGELAIAVEVCTRNFRDGLAFLTTGAAINADEWAATCAGLDFAAEAARFRNYQGACLTIPKRWEKGKRGACRVPWQLQLVAGLAGEAALDRATVARLMDSPLSESFVLLTARQAWNGDESIFSEEDQRGLEILTELEKANGTS